MSKQYVGKVKGRGYFNGVHTSHVSKFMQASEYTDKLRASGISRWQTVCSTKAVFKRNLSDVSPEYIYSSKEDFEEGLENLDIVHPERFANSTYVTVTPMDMSILKKIKLEPYTTSKCEKRVLKSRKNPWASNQIINIEHNATSSNVQTCMHCGTNIYQDEARMRLDRTSICIHCLVILGKNIEEAYKATPEQYKEDYLLARAMEI